MGMLVKTETTLDPDTYIPVKTMTFSFSTEALYTDIFNGNKNREALNAVFQRIRNELHTEVDTVLNSVINEMLASAVCRIRC